jgi:DNA-binding CsgD family transcriptional regulator
MTTTALIARHADRRARAPRLSSGLAMGLAALVLSVALAWLADGFLVRLLLHQAANRAAEEVQLGLVDRVTLADFATPVGPARLDDLALRLDPFIARLRNDSSGILRVNVIGNDGTILYSDLVAARGRTIPLVDRPELETALSGGIGADETMLGGEENADLHAAHSRALEVYVPVHLGGTVAGAYEIYEDIGPLRMARSLVWAALIVSWCVLGIAGLALRKRLEPVRREHAERTLVSGAPAANPEQDWHARLTPREIEVLRLMAMCHRNRDIAEQLGVSEETIRTHVKRILRKLDQPDRAQAVIAALREGLLELP